MWYFLSLLLALSVSCENFPFMNPSLPWEERVEDLLGRLTLDEIQDQLATGSGPSPNISRLGIGPFQWWSNCGRGDVRAGNATSFPESLGLAAAFSPELLFDVTKVTALETRAKNNYFEKHGKFGIHQGLSCFSPNLDIYRDARWGRNEETWGEDPYMAEIYARAFVTSLQGDDPRYALVTATCKHYTASGGPDSYPENRFTFDAKVSMRDLQMTFLPGFKGCIDAGSYGLLCAYNKINGIPACANKETLNDILRTDWGFKGYVISDVAAIENMIFTQHYYNNTVDTVAGSINGGCNINAASNSQPNHTNAYYSMVQAVREGKLTEQTVRESMKQTLYTRFRLGEFDPPGMNPYKKLDPSIIQSPDHQLLSVEAALKTFVLLKNRGNFLPMKQTKYDNVAIIGPMINNPKAQTGNYSPTIMPTYTTTPLETLSKYLAHSVTSTNGCLGDNNCLQYNQTAVIQAVQNSDAIIVCLGLGNDVEQEGNDRRNISLPGHQLDILKDAVAHSPASTPIVLIMFNGGAVDLRWPDGEDRVTSILEVFYPSQATGKAVYNALVMGGGSLSVPAGRLPITWPMSDDQIPPITNFTMEGRTYRYSPPEPLYPFGYGLSYTTFHYSNLTYSDSIAAGVNFTGSVQVQNTGNIDADEVIQVYFSWNRPSVPAPKIQLGNFTRKLIPAGSTVTVQFTIPARIMALWVDDSTGWKIEYGTYNFYVGGQQPNQKKNVGSNVLKGFFTIFADKYLGRSR
ncbi:hypothetical protein LOTGIDRAFT_236081 [Lottia gigantea]|uniref:Fibronectin type III-like domain-containing protein n=1 Tax=Lottia gigantea TaxID=225164 RepID=V3ZQT9_LOTGI|nr:hypothetical protein LOTGIDRAFT_236081 [Lottia gigantea]ESO84870.1 hypothetical protein LOTGIDRAFT_236081 [Lottia gigantea]